MRCRRLLIDARREFSSRGSSSPSGDMIEMRQYAIQPAHFAEFLRLAEKIKPVRYELQPCFATLRCDLSSSMDLNSYLHFYRYRDHDDRDATRRRSAADQRWASYLGQAKPLFAQQSSSIFRPAAAIMERIGADPEPEAAAERRRRLPMVELRRYRLQAGYDTVPKALAAFEAALPAKIEAARSAGVENEVEMLMYSDVGRLNELVEVWRFERASDTMRAREASRAVPVWRECIQTLTGLTESFDSSFLYEC